MITLTTSESIRNVLGSATTISYDKMVLDEIRISPIQKTIVSRVRLTSTTDAKARIVTGQLHIEANTSFISLEIDHLDMAYRATLTAGQKTAVEGIISDAQSALEGGLVDIGAVAGTESSGV